MHDAGGAELIAAYIKKHEKQFHFKPFVVGPAKSIFEREHIPFSLLENDRDAITQVIRNNRDAQYLLVGTMYHTRIELMAIQEARIAHLYAIAYIDSWVNYRERFDYPRSGWQNNLPDELWVGDIEAQRMAESLFPKSLPIKFVKNEYFKNIEEKVKNLNADKGHNRILFLTNSDPRDDHGVAFSWLLDAVQNIDMKTEILIRFHPSDDQKWFKDFHDKQRFQVSVSKEGELAKDLAQAKIVIGSETTALVVAALCGLPSVCINARGVDIKSPFPYVMIIDDKSELKTYLKRIFQNV